MSYDVETRSLFGRATAVGAAGPFTLIIDRPAGSESGGGLGFSGGQLLNLAVAGCISNDLFREAAKRGLSLSQVIVRASSEYVGKPAISTDITYEVELSGDSPAEQLRELVEHVDRIAEIPNSLRGGTEVRLTAIEVAGSD